MTTNEPAARRGVFITFEGSDGSGKSTQIGLLRDALAARGLPVVQTREPGGTPLGQQVRRLLLRWRADDGADAAAGDGPVPEAEMLLMAADRAQHVARVVRPALARGHIVLSDRYVDSSYAYQAGALGLPADDVVRVNDVATGRLVPDLTLWLDLDPKHAFGRDDADGVPDRIEKRGDEFQNKVRAAYATLAAAAPERWVRVFVQNRTIDDVHTEIARIVTTFLEKRGRMR